MVFAQVWHFWIALPLTLGAVLFGVFMVIGYLNKVVRPKYPPRGRS